MDNMNADWSGVAPQLVMRYPALTTAHVSTREWVGAMRGMRTALSQHTHATEIQTIIREK